MSLIVKDRMYGLMSEGLHSVTITKVEDLGLQETRFGPKECAAIYFTDDQKGRPVDISLRVAQSLQPDSSLARFLTALSIPFGDAFDLRELIGLKCQVVIQHKEKDSEIHATVAAVLKVHKRAGTASAFKTASEIPQI